VGAGMANFKVVLAFAWEGEVEEKELTYNTM
jgi:hypothetical protein